MLVTMPRTMRQALSTCGARRTDRPRRLMGLFAIVGAGMMAAAAVLAVVGSSTALAVGVTGALVQAGGFVGAFWWAGPPPPPRCNRGQV
jgi:hypothetical protein